MKTSADRCIDTGTDELPCAVRDRVAIVTLDRPQARNALSDQLSPALREVIRMCSGDATVGAVLITGAGTAFCAGGDVKGMGAASNPARRDWTVDQRVADLQDRQRRLAWRARPAASAAPVPRRSPGSTGCCRRSRRCVLPSPGGEHDPRRPRLNATCAESEVRKLQRTAQGLPSKRCGRP